jgi:ABC-2 type transport system ATP-binding protein
MALTAEELVVIGRGKLISQSTTKQFVDQASGSSIKVRSPQLDQLQSVLQQSNLITRIEDVEDEGKVLFVDGEVTTDSIGETAAAQGLVLHELTLQRGSLEQAFMQMTGDSVEYHAHDNGQPASPAAPAEIVAAEEEKS